MRTAQSFWDGIAEKYAKSPIKDEADYERSLERARAYLKPGDRVLELGAGTGGTAIRLAPLVSEILVTDISPKMIEIAKERVRDSGNVNITCETSDELLSGIAGRFDAVIAFNLLHLLGDLDAFLDRLGELVEPGGVLISKTPCRSEKRFDFMSLALRIILPPMQLIGKAPPVRIRTVRDLEATLQNHGFDIVETMQGPKGDMRRFIVARRV